MDDDEHERAGAEEIRGIAADTELVDLTRRWVARSIEHRYSYHFRWMGLPIIQYPQDMVAMQELVWRTQPDVIVECGVARGGSVVFYASLLHLLDRGGRVVGIDREIRAPNRAAIEAHPMARYIHLIERSSTDAQTVAEVRAMIAPGARVLVALDSNHTHAHVLSELELYAPFVRAGGYLVVFDTVIEQLPPPADRPWAPGNSPHSAVTEFLAGNARFEIDAAIHDKLQITVAPHGYLRCVADPP